MKIYIGKYKSYLGPYQIAEKIMFWANKYEDKRVHAFGRWLAENNNGEDSWLTKVCQWIDSKKKRKVNIHIDNYDTWSMDNTLALIILPMLIQLNKTKHGSPYTDDADVPEYLRSTAAPKKVNDYDTDAYHFDRWDWILREMIWTFKQLVSDDGENQFYSGKHDISWKPTDIGGNEVSEENAEFFELQKGPNDTFSIDMEGLQAYNERIANGLRLFGKYYRALWD